MAFLPPMRSVEEARREIRASKCFDKEGLVSTHEIELQREQMRRLSVQGVERKRVQSTVVEASIPASVPLRGLRPISIAQLTVGLHHEGRVLLGKLCVEPIKFVAVQTIVADEEGKAARLSVYNAVSSDEPMSRIRSMFPIGARVGIKVPFLKLAADGGYTIRVDNPANFERLPHVHPSPPAEAPSAGPSLDNSAIIEQAQRLRSDGNAAFKMEDWKQAVRLYTEAISALLVATGSGRGDALQVSGSKEAANHGLVEVRQELVLAYSNRSESRIRLNHFEKAVTDANKSLQIQPNHVKSMFRKGRALQGFHQYREAALCFQAALDLDLGSKNELKEALRVSRACDEQSTTGLYNLSLLCKEVEKGKSPECGDFIGNVAIEIAGGDGFKGRCMLVTQDVKCGQLLLVSRAVAVAREKKETSYLALHEETCREGRRFYLAHDGDLLVQLIERARNSRRFRQQIYSLQASRVPRAGFDLELAIPSMALFRPNEMDEATIEEYDDDVGGGGSGGVDGGGGGATLDVDRIRGVAEINAFEHSGKLSSALWLAPSFINHSCVPNATWIVIGDYMFVRAARHVSKGEEVTISYTSPLQPQARRAELIRESWGFECDCERCAFEESVRGSTSPMVTSWLRSEAQKDEELEGVAEDLEWALKRCTIICESKKQLQWLRCSFAPAYLEAHRKRLPMISLLEGFPSLESVVESVQEVLGGVESVVMQLRPIWFGPCSTRLRQSLLAMSECLYGKDQTTASLKSILSNRRSLYFGSKADLHASHHRAQPE